MWMFERMYNAFVPVQTKKNYHFLSGTRTNKLLWLRTNYFLIRSPQPHASNQLSKIQYYFPVRRAEHQMLPVTKRKARELQICFRSDSSCNNQQFPVRDAQISGCTDWCINDFPDFPVTDWCVFPDGVSALNNYLAGWVLNSAPLI